MTQDNSQQWWADGPGPAAGDPDTGLTVREARVALAAAGTALALWRTHRRDCKRCAALVPPAGPRQACYRGGRLLARLLAAQDRARGAQAALAAVKIARPGQLF